ncbi:hypothetical protein BH23CHL2_BH23CHL2_07600 [soil metagenome]
MTKQERHDDLDFRLDRALDALAAGHAPAPDTDDDYLDLVDTARIVRRLREPDTPDEAFASDLANMLARELGTDSSNGQVLRADRVVHRISPTGRRGRWLVAGLAALLRILGVGVIAGAFAGLLTIGVGGRIAMRISGALYTRQHPGSTVITDSSGQEVGTITLAGTVDLLAQGMFVGMVGGLMYVILRRWLPDALRVRSVASGAIFLLITGTLFVDGDNPDFTRIGIPWLNILMFGLIVLAFGAFVAPVAERLASTFEQSRGRSGVRRLGTSVMKLGLYLAGALGLLLTLQFMAIGMVAGSADLIGNIRNGSGLIETLTIVVAMSVALPIPLLSLLSSRLAIKLAPDSIADFLAPRQTLFISAGRRLLLFAVVGGTIIFLHAVSTILTS